jgi:hypothetical protein
MRSIQKAILSTLAYADIFDYPLRENEIWRFLISNFQFPTPYLIRGNFQKKLLALSARVSKKEGFYFLKGREKIVAIRKKRERWSKEKLKIAHRVAKWLRLIPTIKMVGVTGALAMNNSDKSDDIDLLIVTRGNRLWLTRLATVLLVELMANRRHPGDKEVADKICLNMFLDEDHLGVPKKEQDLFSAHEVCQLKPIWDRDGTYQKFLKGNRWVEKYLPNVIKFKVQSSKSKIIVQNSKLFSFLILLCNFSFFIFLFSFIERFVYRLQLNYMKSKRTTEIVEPYRIRFHPQDCRGWIMVEYQKRLKKLEIR